MSRLSLASASVRGSSAGGRDCLRRNFATLLLTSVLVAMPLPASDEKTDVIFLENGDRLTGEIKGLERGKLLFKTDSLGTVAIEWAEIRSLASSDVFELELENGERYFGSLPPRSDAGKIEVAGEDATELLEKADVVRLTPIESTFWGRVDGSLDAGFSFSQASQSTQLNLGVNASIRSRKYLRKLEVSSIVNDREDTETIHRSVGSFEFSRFVSRRWSFLTIGTGERNEELGLRLRTTASVGARRTIAQSNAGSFSFVWAGAVNRESYLGPDPQQTNFEAVGVVELEKFRFDDPEIDFSVSLAILPSLTDSGRVRIEFQSRLRREIVKDFFVSLSLYDSYDSDPPVSGVERNDWGLTSSFGWSF